MPRIAANRFLKRASGDPDGRVVVEVLNTATHRWRLKTGGKLINPPPAALQMKKTIINSYDQLVELLVQNGEEIAEIEQFEDVVIYHGTLHNIYYQTLLMELTARLAIPYSR